MCSDHFAPWTRAQGHAGFAWSWLGAALQDTTMTFGTVCAPGQRYHSAVIAQAAATLAEMFEGRFWIAVGSGEALNERITGTPWPSKPERNTRLHRSVEAMRRLWAGADVIVDHAGAAGRAHLYVHAPQPPMVVGAAISPETARWMGRWADALITVAGSRDAMQRVMDAFREGGGEGKPIFLQVPLSFAPTDAEADSLAREQWAQAALEPAQLADLETPEAFERATANVTVADVTRTVRSSSDIRRHVDWVAEDLELGFSRVYLHNVARDHQELFIDACGDVLLPAIGLSAPVAR